VSIHYCAGCGTFIEPERADDAAGCVDCGRAFCGTPHLEEHQSLGACPDQADGGLDLGPTP
jgi:hypothetical protein